ncbi:TetR/AcrR family transcriptional regulator [Pseudomonas sp. GD03842]|uniref:TetR/AcrR family transcriptional regulator n=1 Tax=Pseudomonas sp. GD03842 TaxID=2975385 RepID=UPI0024494032|nr:TetR/AcrR family transcriptional regulator [Pseudomonas sp. GD03842]MDH0748204.1 TetR/AcrR family transcriptional regulator [Pseudomonas sp. GD03842]
MRYAEDHKAQTHQRILHEAAARFRRDGIGATGLQPLMKALGLTHGGFYAHFKSKDDLVEKALRCAADQSAAVEKAPLPAETFIEKYLSAGHCAAPENGCPLPTMSSELGQRGQPSEITDEVIHRMLAKLEAGLPAGRQTSEQQDRDMCVMIMSSLVGAISLARSTKDPALAERILETTCAQLKQQIALV